MPRNVLCGPHFAWSDDLMLVEQEDWNPRCVQEFIDLRPPFTHSRPSVTILGGLPDSMCLVKNQYIQAVALGIHERVEILEDRAGSGLSESADVAKRLGESPRPGCVNHFPTTSS